MTRVSEEETGGLWGGVGPLRQKQSPQQKLLVHWRPKDTKDSCERGVIQLESELSLEGHAAPAGPGRSLSDPSRAGARPA